MPTTTKNEPKHWRWPGWPEGLTETRHGYRFDGDLSRRAVDACLAAVGHAEGPGLLFDLCWRGRLDPADAELAGIVAEIYRTADHRACPLGRGEWVQLLRRAGFTHDGRRTDPPAEPVTLFRGCWPERIALDHNGHRVEFDPFGQPVDPEAEIVEVLDTRRGLSWTTDIDTARQFAHGGVRGEREVGGIYSATIAPRHLLASFGDGEHLVDPIALRVVTAVEHALDSPR